MAGIIVEGGIGKEKRTWLCFVSSMLEPIPRADTSWRVSIWSIEAFDVDIGASSGKHSKVPKRRPSLLHILDILSRINAPEGENSIAVFIVLEIHPVLVASL